MDHEGLGLLLALVLEGLLLFLLHVVLSGDQVLGFGLELIVEHLEL